MHAWARGIQEGMRDEWLEEEQDFEPFDYLCFVIASIWAFLAGMGFIGNDD